MFAGRGLAVCKRLPLFAMRLERHVIGFRGCMMGQSVWESKILRCEKVVCQGRHVTRAV